MKSFLVMIASSPSSPLAMRGLQTALNLQSKGSVSIMLMQDAVFAALRGSLSRSADILRQLRRNTDSIHVLTEHLHKRGFSADDVLETVRIIDYAQLVKLMMDEETSTIGVF